MSFTVTEREREAIRWTLLALPIITLAVVVFVASVIIREFFDILVMFFLAWLLAFILDPAVTRIVARLPFLPRGVAATFVFIVTVVIAIVLVALIASSVISSLTAIIGTAPTISDAIARLVAPVQEQLKAFGFDINVTVAVNDLVRQVSANASGLLTIAVNSGLNLFSEGSAIIFISVVMVAQKQSFLHYARRLVPESQQGLYDQFVAAVGRSFGGFIRGQFGLAALYGVIAGLIALVFGVPFAPVIAIVTLLLQSVPYFGQLVSWIPLILVTFIFAPGVLLPVAIVGLVLLLAVQQFVTPRVMGSAVGLNPILVLAAVFIGAQVAGVIGAVFGVPVLAVFATLFETWLDRVRPEESPADTASAPLPAGPALRDPRSPPGTDDALGDAPRLAGTASKG